MGIRAHAVARKFTIDTRTAFSRVFEFFEHQHSGALPQHESVAVLVPRATGLFRCIVAT